MQLNNKKSKKIKQTNKNADNASIVCIIVECAQFHHRFRPAKKQIVTTRKLIEPYRKNCNLVGWSIWYQTSQECIIGKHHSEHTRIHTVARARATPANWCDDNDRGWLKQIQSTTLQSIVNDCKRSAIARFVQDLQLNNVGLTYRFQDYKIFVERRRLDFTRSFECVCAASVGCFFILLRF